MKNFKNLAIHKAITLTAVVFCLTGCQTMNTFIKEVKSVDFGTALSGEDKTTAEFLINADCPRVDVIEELSSVTTLGNTPSGLNPGVMSEIKIMQVASACEYDAQSVTADISVSFEAKLGMDGLTSAEPVYTYPYFIAVTTPGGRILAKELFDAPIKYTVNNNTIIYKDMVRQIIPVIDRNDGGRHTILVGFQLTPDQLAYNRQMLALKEQQEEQTKRRAVKQSQGLQSVAIIPNDETLEPENTGYTNTDNMPVLLTAPTP